MVRSFSSKYLRSSVILIILFIVCSVDLLSRDVYKAVSRYDYYTTEKTVEIAVWIPASKSELSVTVDIVFEFDHLRKGDKVTAGQINIFDFPMDGFHTGNNEVTVSYNENGKWVGSDKVNIMIREDRYNAVKIDRVSGGLIVEGLPFIPFGFYNYSPVQAGLAEEEVVKGFNMMSPYQTNEGKTLKERKAYMDRCAAVGMKVNYNVLSLAGGGGVAHEKYDKLSKHKRLKMLRKEIETFKDHPALLSWYISDEPVGQGVPPDSLLNAYKLIKELDPYHPITLVFMSPWMAKDYSHVMDIVMADPYPIPNGKVDEVGATAALLNTEFFLDKPVWIVPQAFGGNEWWEREPTPQELRVMTYLGIINNAMGIQYFIRHGLNSFPKSTVAWNECGAMALEIAELTPYLFSAEQVLEIASPDIDIQLKGYHLEGAFVVIAVNTVNKPMEFSFTIDGFGYSGSAAVMFEDRYVSVRQGKVEDIIDAYGTRVYRIRYMMTKSKGPRVHTKNLIKDPSFENITGLGIPASCYARPQGDKGATYFIDSRISARGAHSLRMTTPTDGEGISLSFYRLRIEPGHSYTMSVQAKAIPLKYRDLAKKTFFRKLCGCGPDAEDFPLFTMSLGDCEESFITDGEWKEYSFSCVPEPEFGSTQISPVFKMDGKGTAWFDLIQLYPDMGIKSFVNRNSNDISIGLNTVHQDAKIFYTLDGTEPTEASEPFRGIFKINTSSTVKAIAYKDSRRVGYIERYFVVSFATGRYVEYKHKYSSKYDAGYKDGLVDGILAASDYKDGKWQGFEGDNLDVVINLKSIKSVREIELRFLKDHASWIFLPAGIKILWSADGNEYFEFNGERSLSTTDNINIYTYTNSEGAGARYIRIVAKNTGSCPEGHPGAGGKAWLFTDEIIIQ
ncbi:MAG: chitobiase/beta-hexosaminidase C-terminal domain-containing protein [Bacteroidales bacterium]|nr:chitobiase/beta-hexosaminidase C-terminal domain-containing protein [Bacteroidales bacterium]